jgi:type I restriction enzyme S subunit
LEVQPGDLLFSRKNTYDLVAAAAYVFETRPKLMLPDLIFRLRLGTDTEMEGAFLWQQLLVPHLRKRIQALAGGAAGSMPNISKAKLKTVPIIKPPLKQQRQFREVCYLARVANLKASTVNFESDRLFLSLQQRAFSGQL